MSTIKRNSDKKDKPKGNYKKVKKKSFKMWVEEFGKKVKGFFKEHYSENTLVFAYFMFVICLFIAWLVWLSPRIFARNFAVFDFINTIITIRYTFLLIFILIIFKFFFIKKSFKIGPILFSAVLITYLILYDFIVNILGNFISGFILILMSIIFLLGYFFYSKYFKKINWWLIWTIVGILSFCLIGITFIDDHAGEKEMKLGLRNCSNGSQQLGEINCGGISRHVIANEQVNYCTFDFDYNFSNGSVNFNFSNGSNNSVNLTDKIKFIVPENLVRIEFKLNGTLENETACLSGWEYVRYPTYEEFRENKNTFIQWMGILLVFALISIPTFVNTIKKLFEEDK